MSVGSGLRYLCFVLMSHDPKKLELNGMTSFGVHGSASIYVDDAEWAKETAI